ncbi:MAG: DUF819 family protein [Clostridiales bacterium]|nr:DUF819 family protein [Clostridiales bacterium]
MISNLFIIIAILLVPRLMVLLSARYKVFDLLGPVFLCYLLGFLFSFIIKDTSIAMSISEILVPISIPLILFSADLKSYKKLAKPVTKSFLFLIICVLIISSLGFLIFRAYVPEANKFSGMMAGLYTGGTPNLIAIAMALGVDETQIVIANTADLIVGGVYFFLLLSVVPRIAHKFLPKNNYIDPLDRSLLKELESEFLPGKSFFSIKGILQRMPLLLLSILCTGVSVLFSLLLTDSLDVLIIILMVTIFGIGFSFNKKIRAVPNSFNTGQYLIYMFSFAIGLSFSLEHVNLQILPLLSFFAFVQYTSLILHFILCKIANIDGNISVITSTVGIYGPAFVIPVANALKDKNVILPGIICGIVGYAIGNFLGIGLALFLGLL